MKLEKNRSVRNLFKLNNGLPMGEREKIEITRQGARRSVIVEGIRQILLYGTEEMVFLMAKERLVICGKELDCVNYVSGAIGICGEITSIAFVQGGEE